MNAAIKVGIGVASFITLAIVGSKTGRGRISDTAGGVWGFTTDVAGDLKNSVTGLFTKNDKKAKTKTKTK